MDTLRIRDLSLDRAEKYLAYTDVVTDDGHINRPTYDPAKFLQLADKIFEYISQDEEEQHV